METESAAQYNARANECSANADAASRKLFSIERSKGREARGGRPDAE